MGIIYPQYIDLAPYSMANYYRKKGYIIEKPKQKIKINVKDLSDGCQQKVKCKCDNCQEEFLRKFAKIKEDITYCKKCYGIKAKQTFLKKYGVDNPNKCNLIKEKTKKTNLQKYGCEYTFQNEDVKEKIKNSLLNNYGVEHALQNDQIKEKMKETMLAKYGCDNALKNNEIKEKVKNTCLKKYGYTCALKNEKVKEKIKNTCLKKYGVDNPAKFYKIKDKIRETNSKHYKNAKTSIQQKHICNLLMGEINKNIKGYFADIAINKTIIEYDGSGHWLSVDVYGMTKEEFNIKESIREHVFLDNGYKIIRIICVNDILPNDDILINKIFSIQNKLLLSNHSIAKWDVLKDKIYYK